MQIRFGAYNHTFRLELLFLVEQIGQRVPKWHSKDYFGLKCILSYNVPIQTIVSPYDANCVTTLIYPTTDLDFLFGILFSFDLSFNFLFFETCTKPFCKRHNPVIVITIRRHGLYTGKCTRLYILEIMKAWPLCILWTRGYAYLLTQLYKIKTFG